MPLAYMGVLGVSGDDDPAFDIPASVDEPALSVQPELVQPRKATAPPVSTADHRVQPKAPARAATPNAPPANSRGGFPWWILVVLLVAADGKKRR